MQEEEQGLRALDFDDLTDFSNYDEPELDGITPQDHHQGKSPTTYPQSYLKQQLRASSPLESGGYLLLRLEND